MKRNFAYSVIAFLAVVTCSLASALTHLLVGLDDGKLFLLRLFFFGVVGGGAIAWLLLKILNSIAMAVKSSGDYMSPFLLTRNFIFVSIALIALSAALGVALSYEVARELKVAHEKEKEKQENEKLAAAKAAEAEKQNAARAVEAERQRIASLTPKQREAEEMQKREKAKAAACENSRKQFFACDKYSGNSYVDCIAALHAPEDCGEIAAQHMLDHLRPR